jgi:hypothetical protein
MAAATPPALILFESCVGNFNGSVDGPADKGGTAEQLVAASGIIADPGWIEADTFIKFADHAQAFYAVWISEKFLVLFEVFVDRDQD